jgi:ureidoglycolate dehydrogenase (NAD+)
LLHPIGGFKGFGLAFFSSILTGGLGGRKLAIEKTRASEGGEHFFYVIDLQQFVGREKFEERLSSAIEKIHELPPAQGDDRVTLPGELEWESAMTAQKEGLALHKQHVADLEMLGQKHKVEITWG